MSTPDAAGQPTVANQHPPAPFVSPSLHDGMLSRCLMASQRHCMTGAAPVALIWVVGHRSSIPAGICASEDQISCRRRGAFGVRVEPQGEAVPVDEVLPCHVEEGRCDCQLGQRRERQALHACYASDQEAKDCMTPEHMHGHSCHTSS